MGRVKSQLRQDYKPGFSTPRPRRPVVWLAGALGLLALAGITALLVSPDQASRDDNTVAQESRSDPTTASDLSVRRVELALPPRNQPSGNEQGSADTGAGPDASAGKQGLSINTAVPATGSNAADPQASTGLALAKDAIVEGAPQQNSQQAAPAPAPLPAGELLVVTVKSGDTLDRLFRRNGLSVSDLALMLRLKEARNGLAKILPGDEIEVRHEQATVLELSRQLSEELTLKLIRQDQGYAAEFLANPVERTVTFAQGRIDNSLFLAGTEAGLSQTLVMNLAGIFAWDVDFALDIRSGDSFALVYEEVWQDGVRLRDGAVLAAEFINQGRKVRAIRYQDPEGRVDYYTPEGLSLRKAFLRAPVDFSRVSSNFNPNRLHPVLKTRRPHRGVDYAARTGTPIKAAGDGKIIFRGKNGGYGNCVIIQHGGNITTLYAHMSRFDKGAPLGRRVRQGQTIGYVGATGLANGAHLHYEYRLNGVHRNPRTVPLPEAEPIPAQYRAMFEEASRPLISQLDAISPTRLAALDPSR